MTKTKFFDRMNSLVTYRKWNHQYAQTLMVYDPDARSAVTAYLLGLDQLVEELLKRGIENKPASVTTPLTSERAKRWAYEFGQETYESCVPHAKDFDRALVPFLRAHEDALENFRQYCRQRIEA